MRDHTISTFLEQLAARQPAPGGGAVAALHAAQAAGLLGMVARYSTRPRNAQHETVVSRVLTEADALRQQAIELVEDDAVAFTAVIHAYRLPKDTDTERGIRSVSIAAALAGAAEPPAAVIATSERLVALAEALLPAANRNVLSDVAAASEAAHAAATTARINVEVNLGGITDPGTRQRLSEIAARVSPITERAERVTAAVREEIAR